MKKKEQVGVLSSHLKITKDCWVVEDEVKDLQLVKTAESTLRKKFDCRRMSKALGTIVV